MIPRDCPFCRRQPLLTEQEGIGRTGKEFKAFLQCNCRARPCILAITYESSTLWPGSPEGARAEVVRLWNAEDLF